MDRPVVSPIRGHTHGIAGKSHQIGPLDREADQTRHDSTGVAHLLQTVFLASMQSYFTFFLIDKFGISIRDAQLCLFAFLAASAIGIVGGGYIGDKIGRKYVIWCSILGAAPFALCLPYAGYAVTIALSVIVGLVISSAFSAILVFATRT